MALEEGSTSVPKQRRAKKTYEAILGAAQEILEEQGLEALNSNAIVERAGVTAPVFYRYFRNKHDLLLVLGNRLTDAQNDLYLDALDIFDESNQGFLNMEDRAFRLLSETFDVTKGFVGAYALLVSLRAIPRLSRVRQESNQQMAKLTAKRLRQLRPELGPQEAYDRCRLAIEIGYSAIEMLLEEPRMSRNRVFKQTAAAVMNAYTS